MRKSINIFLMSAILVSGFCGCAKSIPQDVDTVDLRYRVDDSYNLSARSAQSFAIVVTSSADWTISSEHPDWCIIDIEEGTASDAAMVLVGKGQKTTAHVQYYDNLNLDDRVDHIYIRSGKWLGKTVTVNQKGIAYLTIPEEELNLQVIKSGGDVSFHISSNQKWSARVTEGDWISITQGAEGEFDGTVTVKATDNPQEMRYAAVTVYDRHNDEMYVVRYTQDGVQLDPATFEIRAGYDQLATSLNVIANSKWTAVKDNENDTWYEIVNPANEGNATLNLILTKNDNPGLRIANIIIKSVPVNPDDYVAEKVITIKQAYHILPIRYYFDNDTMGSWNSDWENTPVWTKGVGTLFTSRARLHNGEMPFGTYTFRWSSISPEARVRHWFCYTDGQEVKFNIVAPDKAIAVEFNASSSGVSGKPDIGSSYDIDPTVPHELTLKFDPAGAEYCHVTYLVDGVELTSFDSSASVMHGIKWGVDVNMYIGVDTGGSAICEWFDYTEPVNWED